MSAPSRSASCLTASLREPFEFEAPVNSPEFSLSASSARSLPSPLPSALPPSAIHQAKPSPIVASRLPRSFRPCFPSIVAKLLPRPTKPNPFCRSSPSSSPSLCLCLCISSLYLSINPYAHPCPLYSSSLRFPFHTQLYTSLHAVTATTFVPSLFRSNSLIVFVSLTRPRIVNHRGPSFHGRTHTRAYSTRISIQSTRLCPLFPSTYFSPPPFRCSTVRSSATSAHRHFVSLFLNRAPPRSFRSLFLYSPTTYAREYPMHVSSSHLGIFPPSLRFRSTKRFRAWFFFVNVRALRASAFFVKLDVARHQVRCFVCEAFEDLAGFAVGIEIKPTGFPRLMHEGTRSI